ncbi:MAG: hypothetical protein OHK0039_29100 [Bacteroidia bacterium]
MKAYITPETIANEIMMTRQSDRAVYVIFEGESDNRFWKKFLDLQVCRQRLSFDAAKACKVDDILRQQGYGGKWLVVIDADFRRITHELPTSDRILLTDDHDLEIGLIESSAWDQVLDTYASESKLQGFEADRTLKSALYDVARPIAHLRLLNQQHTLHLRFKPTTPGKPLDMQAVVDKQTMKLQSLDTLLLFYLNLSQRQQPDRQVLVQRMEEMAQQDYDDRQLCNGHDMTQLLYRALVHAVGSLKGKDPQDIEDALILAYDSDDFRKTTLCKTLIQWGETWHLPLLRMDPVR